MASSMTKSKRYYRPTVGQDHIPDPYQWLDRAIPLAIFAAAFVLIAATVWFH